MRNNNNKLYNKIIYNISKEVKNVLYEDMLHFDTAEYQDEEFDITNGHEVRNIIGSVAENMRAYDLDADEFSDDEILELFDKFDESEYTKKIQALSDVLDWYIAAEYENFYINISTESDYSTLSLNRDFEGEEDNISGYVRLNKEKTSEPILYIELRMGEFYNKDVHEMFADIIPETITSFESISHTGLHWSNNESMELGLFLSYSFGVLHNDIRKVNKLIEIYINAQKEIQKLEKKKDKIEVKINEVKNQMERDMMDIKHNKYANKKRKSNK